MGRLVSKNQNTLILFLFLTLVFGMSFAAMTGFLALEAGGALRGVV